jgi:mRNA interferase RelE/StbE
VSAHQPYELILTPPAQRAGGVSKLPEAIATAVIDFLTTALIENPHRVGKELRNDLAGIWSARRGTYRVLYRIHDDLREVVVVRIEHRRDVYRLT